MGRILNSQVKVAYGNTVRCNRLGIKTELSQPYEIDRCQKLIAFFIYNLLWPLGVCDVIHLFWRNGTRSFNDKAVMFWAAVCSKVKEGFFVEFAQIEIA